jgi:hypothetical protein
MAMSTTLTLNSSYIGVDGPGAEKKVSEGIFWLFETE